MLKLRPFSAPSTQCWAVRIHSGAMIVEVQASLPFWNRRAAQGASFASPPSMIVGSGSAGGELVGCGLAGCGLVGWGLAGWDDADAAGAACAGTAKAKLATATANTLDIVLEKDTLISSGCIRDAVLKSRAKRLPTFP